MRASAKSLLCAAAREQGFNLCRIARAGRAPGADALLQWLQEGNHGEMEWMARTAPQRTDPSLLLPGVRSIVVLATNYLVNDPPPPGTTGTSGRIARYARGGDYHEIIRPRLEALAGVLAADGARQLCFVDGGPVLERGWAAACGVSWQGKSTMGIHPRLGTWFFLSVILTTADLDPDDPLPDRCGRCTRCIDACPTRAITGVGRLDARRCISYLTIENKGSIPEEFREAIGDRIFGCDDCLDACPWNRFAQASRDAAFQTRPGAMPRRLHEFLELDNSGFKALFHGSPLLRAKRRGFLRNVCVALGNTGAAEDLPALQRAMLDEEPLIREHATWAADRIRKRLADTG